LIFSQKYLPHKKKALLLHRVFHGIRFKVNKWSLGCRETTFSFLRNLTQHSLYFSNIFGAKSNFPLAENDTTHPKNEAISGMLLQGNSLNE